MNRTMLAFAIFLAFGIVRPANAADGLIAIRSAHSVPQSMDRLEAFAKEKGLTVFLRVDHAAGAQKIGRNLRPTELIVFGNPQGGTPLMECAPSAGIDLPLKALAWQDDAGQVWLGYNDLAWLAARHGIAQSCARAIEAVGKAVAGLVDAAAK